jgi:hypothetical protein
VAREDEVEPLAWWTYVGVGVLWWASLQALGSGGLDRAGAGLLVAGAFFALFGAACWYNGRRCGALHCRISGPGYVALALVALAAAAGLVPLGTGPLLVAFLAVMVGSFAIEHVHERRQGTPG